MSQNREDQPIQIAVPPHEEHDWLDLGALGEVDADGNEVAMWLCLVGGERTETEPA